MRLISFKHRDKDLADAQAAFEFFLSKKMGAWRIWAEVVGKVGESQSKFRVHIYLSDVFADLEVSFDSPAKAFDFAASVPFGAPCNDQIGCDFYSQFIATPAAQAA